MYSQERLSFDSLEDRKEVNEITKKSKRKGSGGPNLKPSQHKKRHENFVKMEGMDTSLFMTNSNTIEIRSPTAIQIEEESKILEEEDELLTMNTSRVNNNG